MVMAQDEEDLYDEEFDFVDENDETDEEEAEEDFGEEEAGEEGEGQAAGEEEGEVDEYGRPEPAANYVVHVYEYKKFKRTIDRPFTPEDAEAFATEYNRTATPYGRTALAGKNDVKPKKTID
jgi:hypothetical protein